MFRWALRKGVDKFERERNYDASTIRDMIDASPVPHCCFYESATCLPPPWSGGSGLLHRAV